MRGVTRGILLLVWASIPLVIGCGQGGETPPTASIDAGDEAASLPDAGASAAAAPDTATPATSQAQESQPSRYSGTPAESPSQTASAPRYPSFAVQNTKVKISTSQGDIVVRLFADKAPLTVDNFLRQYVETSFYNGTIFHYADEGLIAAGGFTPDLQDKPASSPVRNEANNGLKNTRGTVAMGRSPDDIDSATSQFFINIQDNPTLDHRGSSAEEFGYCVFGEVIEGMDVAEQISKAPKRDVDDLSNVPTDAITIKSVTVLP